MTRADILAQARDALRRRAWTEGYRLLAEADRDGPLAPDDLERLATAAHLTGRDAESTGLWARAHHEFLKAGAVDRAVRCAFWLAVGLIVLAGLSGVFSALSMMAVNIFAGLAALFAALLFVLVGIMAARITTEFILIVFRINENLDAIRQRGGM